MTAAKVFSHHLVSTGLRQRLRFLLRMCCLLAASAYAQNDHAQPKIGDVSDGSRAVPVHLIDLYDADSVLVRAADRPLLPFSTKVTCGQCHNYEKVQTGWHFNAADSGQDKGRRGQPWILVDQKTGTQLPLSWRGWPGTYRPAQIGMNAWQFTLAFGRHLPGGGICEQTSSDPPALFLRRQISGSLEINCLSCHDAEAAHDQAEYANQIARQNFRWAAAATSGFVNVRGAARDVPDNYDLYSGQALDDPKLMSPNMRYDLSRFNTQGKVFFDIKRRIPNERCYFCHSTQYTGTAPSQRWQMEEDVHLSAGLLCVDCHRNGLDHKMVRGYEGEPQAAQNPSAASLSCRGCHVPEDKGAAPLAGRLGAPIPKHAGLPAVHFEKLACTACHAGPWPAAQATSVKTSQAHALGTHGVRRSAGALPHIAAPVFARDDNGKIAPHKLIWPAFWVRFEKGSVIPILPAEVSARAGDLFSGVDSTRSGDWLAIDEQTMLKVLQRLAAADSVKMEAGYVAGGWLYRLDQNSKLTKVRHAAARPYLWPLGHEVRPAAQALGVRGCPDCHALNSPFYFSQVSVDSPLQSDHQAQRTVSTAELAGLSRFYARFFAVTFFLRPFLKWILIIASAILLGLLLWSALQGLGRISKLAAELQKDFK